MEPRHYILFAVMALALQFLLYCFGQTLAWLLNLSTHTKKRVMWIAYLTVNGLLVIHITRLLFIPRPIAWVTVLLLFAFFIRFGTLILARLAKPFGAGKKFNLGLKIFYPIAYLSLISLSIHNAYTPKVVHYSVTIDKPLEPIRIGVASDLHLGNLFGKDQLNKLANIFDEQKVDLILLPGDIMDDKVDAYLSQNMRPHLAKLKAPLGVYATLGNHDFYFQPFHIKEELQQVGIKVLIDQSITIQDKFIIIGRKDEIFISRASTKYLLSKVDNSLPIFLMDHRPTQLALHSELPIDLQVSGHTHNGQIFPANLLTNLMYELSHGYRKIGLGHYFVTSGYGFWGIPMRLGSQSEVMIIDVKGK